MADMFKLRIDGKEYAARPEQTILQVAKEKGIYIPTICYHPRLALLKTCRLCLVDVEGAEMPMAACATPVLEGMVVHTHTDRVDKMRLEALKFLLINHPVECPVCDGQLQSNTRKKSDLRLSGGEELNILKKTSVDRQNVLLVGFV